MAMCNSLSIDVNGLRHAIQDACLTVIKDTAQKIIVYFGHYIYSGGAGRHAWRENAAKEFQIISENISYEYIEIQQGQNPNIELGSSTLNAYAAQIMVALFGNHPPQMTKPGVQTWHNHMQYREQSQAESVYPLPHFDWGDPGADHMLENAFKITKQYFFDGLKRAFASVNFSDFVHVVSG